MGLTNNQMMLIKAIAENKIEDARKCAIACCTEDNTKKNERLCNKYKNMLQGITNNALINIPPNLKGIVDVENLQYYRADRYYLSKREEELLNQIIKMRRASLKLMELQIPYLNSVLLTGESGTGKTAFARYLAFTLELPFIYINFSYLIDSLMGRSSKNLQNVFNFAKNIPCILMLDEIDCIARKRRGRTDGADREMANTTITLLQELDHIKNDTILIAATNIPDELDHAIVRRFSKIHEVKKFNEDDMYHMIIQYLSTLPLSYHEEDVKKFVSAYQNQVQGILLNRLIEIIATTVLEEKEEVVFF